MSNASVTRPDAQRPYGVIALAFGALTLGVGLLTTG
jgi:hypothetical protein